MASSSINRIVADKRNYEGWGTRVGVILAVTGSAVGLGNFLRFPGLASQYNTAAFMVPYLLSLLLVGLPIAWAEWAMGRHGGIRGFHSAPGIFRVIWNHKSAPYLAVLGLIVPVMIYMYYVFIESWCLGYALHYLMGTFDTIGDDEGKYSSFFQEYTGIIGDGSLFTTINMTLGCLLFCVVFNFILIYRGLQKGIEWFCSWAMPLLILCAIILLIRVLTLGTPDPSHPDRSVIQALAFMWDPLKSEVGFMDSLLNHEMWIQAAGQIFFSLSVGFGVIITYSSYLKKKDDIALSSTTAVAGNEFCEVALGGMIIIPAAFIFLGAAATNEVKGSTFGLGFMALPEVFETMPGGRLFGFIFFFLLFLAAVTSSLSMLQPAIAFLEEGLGLNRKGSVAMLGFITLIGTAFIMWFSKDALALDTIDTWVGTMCIYTLATIQVVLFGWVFGIEKGFKELHEGGELTIPSFMKFILKYVTPVFLIVIYVYWIWGKIVSPLLKAGWQGLKAEIFPNTVATISIAFIFIVITLFLLLIAQSVRRWNSQKRHEEVQI